MQIQKLLDNTQGIAIKAGKLKAGDEAVSEVAFSQYHWTKDAADAYLAEHGLKAENPILKNGVFVYTQAAADQFDKLDEFKSAEAEPELFELKNVEIFATGTWNGDKFTERDLDDIVAAFTKQGYRPPVKIGHKESSGDKAYGWVKSLRKVGNKLVADFMDLPKDLYEGIKSRAFDSVSSEIFFNLKRGESVFRRALKAVAILGAEIPAVAGLKPLRASFSLPAGASIESEHSYTLTTEDMNMEIKELQAALEAANAEIAKLKEGTSNADEVKKLQQQIADMQENNRKTEIKKLADTCMIPAYREFIMPILDVATGGTVKEFTLGKGADEKKHDLKGVVTSLIERINKDGKLLFKFATREDAVLPEDAGEIEGTKAASEKVHELTLAYMKENKVEDYQKAMFAVLHENKELAAKYNG